MRKKNAMQIYVLSESMMQMVSLHSLLSHRRRCTRLLNTLGFYLVKDNVAFYLLKKYWDQMENLSRKHALICLHEFKIF